MMVYDCDNLASPVPI